MNDIQKVYKACVRVDRRTFPYPVSFNSVLSYSNLNCTAVIDNMHSEHIDPCVMKYVMYACRFESELMVYSRILQKVKSIDAVFTLNNRGLTNLYFQKNNISSDEECAVITKGLKTQEEKLSRAYRAFDLKCIKEIFGNISDYEFVRAFYGDRKFFSKNEDAIRLAIEFHDLVSLPMILDLLYVNSTVPDMLLDYAYHIQNLDAAILLINHGTNLDSNFLIRAEPFLKWTTIINHMKTICNLSRLSTAQCIDASNIVNISYCSGVSNGLFFIHNTNNVLQLSHSLLDAANGDLRISCYNYYNSLSVFSRILNIVNVSGVNLLLDNNSVSRKAFLYLGTVELPYKKPYIYIPVLYQNAPVILHELTHVVLHYVFNNNGYPYRNSAMKMQYHKIKNEFLSNILNIIGMCDNHNSQLEFCLRSHPLLYANAWYIDKSSRGKLLAFLKSVVSNTNQDIVNKILKTSKYEEVISTIEEKIKIDTLIDLDSASLKHGIRLEILVSRVPGFSTNETTEICDAYYKLQDIVKTSFTEFITVEFSKYSQFLQRMFDYAKRDPATWDAELLPRIIELYTIENSENKLELCKPLVDFFMYTVPEHNNSFYNDLQCHNNVLVLGAVGNSQDKCDADYLS